MARAWSCVAILMVLTVLSYTDRGIIALLVDPIKRDLGITDVEFSFLSGAAFVSLYAVVGLPMGWLADRFSRRWVIYLGATVWSLATICCGLASSYAGLFAARVGVGAGEATLSPAGYSVISDLFPPRRLALAVGVLAAGSAIGGGLAIGVGGLIVEAAKSWTAFGAFAPWQIAFVAVGTPGFFIALLALAIPHTALAAATRTRVGASDIPGFWTWVKLRWRYVFGLSFGVSLHVALAYGTTAWTAAYLARHFHLRPAEIGGVLAPINAICNVIGFVGSGWLVDRLHATGVRDAHFRLFLFNSAVVTAVGTLAFVAANSLPLLLAMLAIVFALFPVTGPAVGHLQISTPPAFRGRIAALFQLILNLIGMGIGPTTVALYSDKVLGGPAHLGGGIALMFVTIGPAAFSVLWLTIRPARDALRDAEADFASSCSVSLTRPSRGGAISGAAG